MQNYMILFLVGKDRPGIVDDLSTYLFQRSANIEDSRMVAMGGCFSVMTLFSCSAQDLDRIKADLDDLRRLGFQVSLHEAEDPTAVPTSVALPLKIEVVSMDHPGIVQKVVHVLHNFNISITSLETHVFRAPLSGAPLFDLLLEAGVPEGVPISKVKEELDQLASDMNLDLSFRK